MLLTVEADRLGMTFNWEDGIVRRGRPRLLLNKVGEIYLGDRILYIQHTHTTVRKSFPSADGPSLDHAPFPQ